MGKQLFRRDRADQVTSPEQLNDYIQVTNPGVWLVLLGTLLILVDILIWTIFGQLDTLLPAGAITQDGRTVCYIKDADRSQVSPGMKRPSPSWWSGSAWMTAIANKKQEGAVPPVVLHRPRTRAAENPLAFGSFLCYIECGKASSAFP